MTIHKQNIKQRQWLKPGRVNKIRVFLSGFLLLFFTSIIANAQEKYIFEAENAKTTGNVSKLADSAASGGFLMTLNKPGQAVEFADLPASGKLAVRYTSVNVGTFSVAINDRPPKRVNIHSSGSLTGSFLFSKIDVSISEGSKLTISIDTSDVALNIDRIIVGEGDRGLPPDIWNLPELPVAGGPFPADWKGISRMYTVPKWWREAKFGAWSHWDPQSMPEQGDWYAR